MPDCYVISWQHEVKYRGSRILHHKTIERDTDRAGAERFAKKWGCQMPAEPTAAAVTNQGEPCDVCTQDPRQKETPPPARPRRQELRQARVRMAMTQAGDLESRRVGIRYGRLLAGLDAGIETLSKQSGQAIDLLDLDDRKRFHEALDVLRGISQRAWSKV